MEESKPYLVAKIAYEPNNPEFPWYVVRYGTVAGQGGLSNGFETFSFETIESACTYLSEMIDRDTDNLKKIIEDKESNGN